MWVRRHLNRSFRRVILVAALLVLFAVSLQQSMPRHVLVALSLILGAAITSWWD